MFGQKKLEVFEDRDSLGITIRWFTPIAIFLLFFTVVWDSFLLFWYSLAFSTDAPWLMVVFPVAHVAVGVYLTYYTLCLFFNKTYIDIVDGFLSVVHKPIPWWRGNRRIHVSDLKQLYVVEKKSSGKNGTTYTYELRAKMRDNNERDILALDGASAEDVQRIEEQIEKYLGIQDMPVKGEYGKSAVAVPDLPLPRRVSYNFSDPVLNSVFQARPRDLIELRSEGLEVVSMIQYDWDDGNSDRLFQLLDPSRKERLVFIEQKNALLKASQERELNLFETNLAKFQLESPPPSITVAGKEYFPSHFKTGKFFPTDHSPGVEVKQWHYATRDQRSFLRVVNFGQTLSLYLGESLQSADFESRLDLDSPPQRARETRERPWREEDLV